MKLTSAVSSLLMCMPHKSNVLVLHPHIRHTAHCTDLGPPPHNTPPPDGAAKSPTQQSLEQIRAPTGVGGTLELLPGRGIAARDEPDEPNIGMCMRGKYAHRRGTWPPS